jgi:hypothetical protein
VSLVVGHWGPKRPSAGGTVRTAGAEVLMEDVESYNPWTVVNLVFHHLAAQGLRPQLGGTDPGAPAAELLRAFGIQPAAEGNRQDSDRVRQELADIRSAMFPE